MKSPDALRVLICSANAGLCQLIRTSLRGVQMRDIHFADNPRAVIAAFTVAQPDVLLVHVEGPENDAGLSTIRFIRRWEKSPNRRIPIVAASQCRDLPTISAAINAGTNEYAVTPASGDMLQKKIMAAVQSDRPFIEHPSYVGPCRRRRQLESYAGPERRIAASPIAVVPVAAE